MTPEPLHIGYVTVMSIYRRVYAYIYICVSDIHVCFRRIVKH